MRSSRNDSGQKFSIRKYRGCYWCTTLGCISAHRSSVFGTPRGIWTWTVLCLDKIHCELTEYIWWWRHSERTYRNEIFHYWPVRSQCQWVTMAINSLSKLLRCRWTMWSRSCKTNFQLTHYSQPFIENRKTFTNYFCFHAMPSNANIKSKFAARKSGVSSSYAFASNRSQSNRWSCRRWRTASTSRVNVEHIVCNGHELSLNETQSKMQKRNRREIRNLSQPKTKNENACDEHQHQIRFDKPFYMRFLFGRLSESVGDLTTTSRLHPFVCLSIFDLVCAGWLAYGIV